MTSSHIESVTVYRSGARVTRVCALGAEAAREESRVRIEGLPLCLDDGSVRVRVERQADGDGALPVAADVRVALDVAAADPAQPKADDRALEAAQDEVARLQAHLAQAQDDLAALARLALRARPDRGEGKAPAASPTAARAALLALRSERRNTLEAQRVRLRAELRRAERKLAELRDADRRRSSARQPREHELRKAVIVSLRSPAEGEAAADGARLVLEYAVPGACWAPSYTLRFDEALGQATLQVRAQVAQQSGEDWQNVAIRLSTAQPEQWSELPELHSRRIGRKQPAPPKRGWRAPPAGAEALYADYDHACRRHRAQREAQQEAERQAQQKAQQEAQQEAERQAQRMEAGGRAEAELRAAEQPLAEGATTIMLGGPSDDLDAFDDEVTDVRHEKPKAAASGSFAGAKRRTIDVQARSSAARSVLSRAAQAEPVAGAPPRPAAQPQALLVAAPRSRSSSLLGGLFGGGGGGLAEPASYALSASDAPAAMARLAGAEGEALHLPPPTPASTDYGCLRMAAPTGYINGHEQTRGRLIAINQVALYLELIATTAFISEPISEQTLAHAFSAAHAGSQIDTTHLPPRHQLVQATHYDYAFAGEAPVDVPSDGTFHNLALLEAPAKSSLLRVVVPRESLDVFRLARIEHDAAHPLLPGPVDVYVGSDYLLSSDIAFTPPGGTADIGLGVDQGVKVARNSRYREESAGLIKGSLLLHHTIDVELANHSGEAIDIEVRERVPVLQDEEDDIKLELGDVSPAWEPYDPKPSTEQSERLKGGHRWKLQLEAGASAALSAAYTVRIAAKHELVGGNRRER